ncbi:MAG: hypothetical protein JXA74_10485 [Anaerolineae bacterium]|nr:hypothetical protein [Anaerolineae bacterium]
MATSLYPLRFEERLRNYGFGGRWIAEVLSKPGLPEDHTLAETWEVVDRPDESSVILNGPLAGRTLHQAIEELGEPLLGADIVARHGKRFPLLIKFLDASNPLGEQIHPNDAWAAQRGGFDTGKTEAWYMLHVRPGASIHAGPRPGLTRDELTGALLRGSSRDCMREFAVQPGDAFLLYAGVMHDARGGVLFCEIMQNSDITLGLNWHVQRAEPDQRAGRAAELADLIHLEEGFDPRTRPVRVAEQGNARTYIMACRHFAMERLDLVAPHTLTSEGQRFAVISAIQGAVRVSGGGVTERLLTGQSCLLPAGLTPIALAPEGQASLLKMYVPDLMADIVAPLRACGVPDAGILGLGGRTCLNDLAPLLASYGAIESPRRSAKAPEPK